MNAVILVGGGGTRLRPLTLAVPKPLVPVVERPLVSYLIENLREHGVTEIVLAASASDRRIEQTLGDGSALGVSLSYCYETEPLGSGLAVKQAARWFKGAFFVCNGDVVSCLDLEAMARSHRERGAAMSIFLAPVSDPSSYGVAEIDAGQRITRFVEKPPRGQEPSNLANAGTWLFEPEVLDHIPDEQMDGSIERLLIPALIADGSLVCGFVADAYWMDVGTSERYLQIHRDLLQGRLPSWLPESIGSEPLLGVNTTVAPGARVAAECYVGDGCALEADAQVGAPSVLGSGCRLAEGASVQRSVLWSGVQVGKGAALRDSIAGTGCWIGDGAVVESSVLASGARVQVGAHLRGARLEPDEVAS